MGQNGQNGSKVVKTGQTDPQFPRETDNNTQHSTDIATYRLNGFRGRLSENTIQEFTIFQNFTDIAWEANMPSLGGIRPIYQIYYDTQLLKD